MCLSIVDPALYPYLLSNQYFNFCFHCAGLKVHKTAHIQQQQQQKSTEWKYTEHTRARVAMGSQGMNRRNDLHRVSLHIWTLPSFLHTMNAYLVPTVSSHSVKW